MLHSFHLRSFQDSSAVTTKTKQNINLVMMALFCIVPISYSIKHCVSQVFAYVLLNAYTEIGWEVNTTRKLCIVFMHNHTIQNNDTKIAEKPLQYREQFIYSKTTVTNQNYIHREIISTRY